MAMLEQVLSNVVGARQRQGRIDQGSNIQQVLMLLLAAGAAKMWMDRRREGQGGAAQPQGGQMGGGQMGGAQNAGQSGGGGLGDILGGVLGGGRGGAGGGGLGGILGSVLGGGGRGGVGGGMGGLGSLLTGAGGMGGLGALIEQFGRNGHGRQVQSWVSTGANPPIQPNELERALGPDVVDDLARQSGMDRDQMLNELSDVLPDAVDQLTPDGVPPPADNLRIKPEYLN